MAPSSHLYMYFYWKAWLMAQQMTNDWQCVEAFKEKKPHKKTQPAMLVNLLSCVKATWILFYNHMISLPKLVPKIIIIYALLLLCWRTRSCQLFNDDLHQCKCQQGKNGQNKPKTKWISDELLHPWQPLIRESKEFTHTVACTESCLLNSSIKV